MKPNENLGFLCLFKESFLSMRTSSSKKKCILFFLVGLLTVGVGVSTVVLNHREKSRNFGSSADPIPEKRQSKECCKKINRNGLDNLNTYGSGFINYNDFGPRINYDYKNLYVVSLMPTDIYYYKGRCLRWYGLHYTPKNLGKSHKEKKWGGFDKKIIRLIYGTPPIHDPSQLDTEETYVKKLGAHYYSPLKNNKNWLIDQSYIDNLVTFFEKIPLDAKVYFHCIHGRGRTTTFLVMYDIFRNGKNISLQEITDRHHCLGREHMLDVKVWKFGNWTEEALRARRDLVIHFYEYMTSGSGYPHKKWSDWIKEKGIKTTNFRIHR